MDKRYFLELLQKYLDGKSTDEENSFLISYYELFQLDDDVMAMMPADRKKNLRIDIKEAIWKNISERENTKKATTIYPLIVKLVAAVIVIAISTIAIVMFNKPAVHNTVLNFQNRQKENKVLYLADGSTIILSAGSKLQYPSSFSGFAKREVSLEGEAFFDITHDASKPFIVHTGKLEVAVLGTAFNIKSIPGDAEVTVVVSRGKVQVSDVNKTIAFVAKGQQVVYSNRDGKSVENKVSSDFKMKWKKDDLLLDDVTVEKAARLLEDRFDVKIFFSDGQIKTKRFTTVFLANEDLDKILRSICGFNGAEYAFSNDKTTVTISKINHH